MNGNGLKIIKLIAIIIVLLLPFHLSCSDQPVQENEKILSGTIMVDSSTEGQAFGQVQFQIGNTFMGEKQYAEAVRAYTMAIRNGYRGIDVYLNRGLAYLALGLYTGALADAQVALDMDLTDVRAYRLRGQAYLKSGNYADAITDFSRALELVPDSIDDYVCRGQAYTGTAEYDKAIADFDKAVLLDPGYGCAHFLKASVNAKYKQDYAGALSGYTKAIELGGDCLHDAYNGRGETYFRLNELENAISDFSMLMEIDKDYWLAYYNRGLCYAAARRYQMAIDDFRQYLALDKHNKYDQVQSADYLASYYKPFADGYTR